jgi:cycloeucalenol cycloisomerase
MSSPSIPGGSRWLSRNDDKAFAEKLFLGFIPVFFVYNAIIQNLGWLDAGTFWHVVQNFCMWIPYCVLLPAWLRRDSEVAWSQSYWFKYNLYMAVWVFFATYYHTEYFFELLGLRYRFPEVTLYFDSALVGPAEATAAGTWQKVPPGMYLNSVAFFIVYHSAAIVCMRRVRSTTLGWSLGAQRAAWVGIVLAAALFFAWAETFFYFLASEVATNVWYVDQAAMLRYGSLFYAMYFVVSFPNVYRLDEDPGDPPWTLSRCVIEASFVGIASLTLLDLWARFVGPIY